MFDVSYLVKGAMERTPRNVKTKGFG